MRFFAANDGGLLSLLSVDVIYHAPGGGTLTLPLGVNVLAASPGRRRCRCSSAPTSSAC